MSLCRAAFPAALGLLLAAAATPGVVAQESAKIFDAPMAVLNPLDPAFSYLLNLDGDAYPDAVGVISGTAFSTVGLYRNDGTGRFTTVWTASTAGIDAGARRAIAYAGDFDGDGPDDFVVIATRRVSPFLGNGLQPPTALPVLNTDTIAGETIRDAWLTDVSNDGLDDLVLLTTTRVSVIVTGSAVLAPTTGFYPLAQSGWARVRIARNPNGTRTAWILGPGSLLPLVIDARTPSTVSFQPGTTSTVSASALAAHAVGDLDNDGDDDVVVFDPSGLGGPRYQIVEQLAGGSWAIRASTIGGPATDLADIDGDGDLDGICCGSGGGGGTVPNAPPQPNTIASNFEIAINGGNGAFATAFRLPSVGADHIAGAADLDGDQDIDLIAGRAIYFSEGSLASDPFPRLPSSLLYSAPGAPWDFADQDGDGDVDAGTLLLYPYGANDGAVGFGFAGRTILNPPTPALSGSTHGDFDGDGDLDFLADFHGGGNASERGMYLLSQVAPGVLVAGPMLFSQPTSYPPLTPSLGPGARYAVDVDGDGRRDALLTTDYSIAISSPTQATSIYRNLGGGGFQAPVTIPYTVKGVADFDSDGLPDLLVSRAANPLGWIRNTGGLAFGPPTWFATFSVSSSGWGVGIADFDHNGSPDLAVPEAGLAPKIFLNQGGVFTAAAVTLPDLGAGVPSQSGRFIDVTDLDRDGESDLLITWPNGMPSGVAVYRGLGNLQFAAPVVHTTNVDGLRDFDGDGTFDLYNWAYRSFHRALVPAGVAPGIYRQYGAPGIGESGVAPILGARGPFRPGSTVDVILRGGPPGSVAIFAFGLSPLAVPLALPGPQDLLLDIASPSTLFVPLTLNGAPGIPGSGAASLSFSIPPPLSGIELFHQAAVVAPSNPAGFALTNAFRILYGG